MIFRSKLRTLWGSVLVLGTLGARVCWASQRISVVIQKGERGHPIVEALREAVGGRYPLSIHELGSNEKNDPIHKGKFLAALEGQDLVVSVGDEATRLLADEIQDTPLYFVGASLLRGDQLADPNVGGILSYNVGQMLDLVRQMDLGPLGLASTPGSEAVEEWIRAGAVQRKLTLVTKRVGRTKDLPGAIRQLMEQTKVIWVLGDPLLSRGAGFRFLVEQALSRRVAVLSTTAWNVDNGALLCLEPSSRRLAEQAGLMMREILDSGLRFPHPRIRQSPPGGTFLINELLSRSYAIDFPSGLRKRILR